MKLAILFIITGSFFITSCTQAPKATDSVDAIKVDIMAKSGSSVGGFLRFSQMSKGVAIEGQLIGLESNGMHGFHIHETGDCSSVDAKSAGGHFNPGGHKHGSPKQKASHLGDLGNIKANLKGMATVSVMAKGATLSPDMKNSILGRAVIVHAGNDDMKSQPSGNAGKRIGCAVIK